MASRVWTTFLVELPVPGEQAIRMSAYLTTRDRADVLRAGPIVPPILPPRGLTLDGAAVHEARTFTGGAHVLA